MKTETSEAQDNESDFNTIMGIISYALNKFMPLLLVGFISFYSFGYISWEPYVTIGLMIFSNNFNFKCGYIHSELDRTHWNETND
jgi:hypothetical protein